MQIVYNINDKEKQQLGKIFKDLDMYDYNSNFIKDGIIGFAVGDALGVPAEFKCKGCF